MMRIETTADEREQGSAGARLEARAAAAWLRRIRLAAVEVLAVGYAWQGHSLDTVARAARTAAHRAPSQQPCTPVIDFQGGGRVTSVRHFRRAPCLFACVSFFNRLIDESGAERARGQPAILHPEAGHERYRGPHGGPLSFERGHEK